jgi:hypothetical protein
MYLYMKMSSSCRQLQVKYRKARVAGKISPFVCRIIKETRETGKKKEKKRTEQKITVIVIRILARKPDPFPGIGNGVRVCQHPLPPRERKQP